MNNTTFILKEKDSNDILLQAEMKEILKVDFCPGKQYVIVDNNNNAVYQVISESFNPS